MRSLLFALALAACAATPPTSPPPSPAVATGHLNGTSWRRVDDMNANPHGATMEFAADRASGHTGCNRWFASVTHDGEELKFGEIGMTRMACQAEVQMATERSFLDVLRNTRFAHYDRDALVLLDANRQQIATLNRE